MGKIHENCADLSSIDERRDLFKNVTSKNDGEKLFVEGGNRFNN